jgi:hypothetical protein
VRLRKLIGAAVVVMAACSPALNWREVRLDRLAVWLPCKPDQGQRNVHLASQDVALDMIGCESSGALFAVSHTRLKDPTQVGAVLRAWRVAALENMRATEADERAFAGTNPAATAGKSAAGPLATTPGIEPVMVEAQGQKPNGDALQARLLWFSSGADVFHIAIYAPRITTDMTETLFSELRLQ